MAQHQPNVDYSLVSSGRCVKKKWMRPSYKFGVCGAPIGKFDQIRIL